MIAEGGAVEIACERVSTGNRSEAEVLVFALAMVFRWVSGEADPLTRAG